MIHKLTPYFLLLLCIVVGCFEGVNASSPQAIEASDVEKNPTAKELQFQLEKLRYFDSIDNKDSLNYYLTSGKRLCNQLEIVDTSTIELQQSAADLYNYLGTKEYKLNNLSASLINYQNASKIYKSLNIEYELAQCLNNIAAIYVKTGSKKIALDYFYQSTIVFERIKDSIGIVLGYNNMARIYRQQKDYQQAQVYLDKALQIVREIDNPGMMTSVLNSMAGLRKDLGDKESAMSLYKEALSASNLADDKVKTAMILNNLGVIHKELGNLEEAKVYFDRAYKVTDEHTFIYEKAFTLVNLAKYYFTKKNFDKTEELALESLLLTDEITNNEARLRAINVLIKLYEEQKNWEKVAHYQNKLIQHTAESEKQLVEAAQQLKLLHFESEIEGYKDRSVNEKLGEKTKSITYYFISFSIVFVLLLVFALIIFLRLRTLRERNKIIIKQSEERKLLLQEVHHRVKNNFQLVSSMLRLQSYNFDDEELRQNFEEAVNRINAMAIVHDVIYRQEKFSDIDAKTYLEKLVEHLHKTGNQKIGIEIESEEIPFKIETLINLGIAINEMITNSFKHAFNEEISHPKIKISLRTLAEKTYELKYRDNGIGISEETYSSNFGMELIETIINNYEGDVSLAPEKEWNTVIKITFKEF